MFYNEILTECKANVTDSLRKFKVKYVDEKWKEEIDFDVTLLDRDVFQNPELPQIPTDVIRGMRDRPQGRIGIHTMYDLWSWKQYEVGEVTYDYGELQSMARDEPIIMDWLEDHRTKSHSGQVWEIELLIDNEISKLVSMQDGRITFGNSIVDDEIMNAPVGGRKEIQGHIYEWTGHRTKAMSNDDVHTIWLFHVERQAVWDEEIINSYGDYVVIDNVFRYLNGNFRYTQLQQSLERNILSYPKQGMWHETNVVYTWTGINMGSFRGDPQQAIALAHDTMVLSDWLEENRP